MGTPLYTDVRLYGEAGVPGVIYGAGPRLVLESNAKRADEHLDLEDLRRATKVIARTLFDLLSLTWCIPASRRTAARSMPTTSSASPCLAALHPQHEIVRTREAARSGRRRTSPSMSGASGIPGAAASTTTSAASMAHGSRWMRRGPRCAPRATPAPDWYGASSVRPTCGGWRERMGHTLAEEKIAQVVQDVDASLVRYLDLVDTGAQVVSPGVAGLSSQLALLNGTWLEARAGRPQQGACRWSAFARPWP